MGTKIVTEADRKRTPPPAAPKGVTLSTKAGANALARSVARTPAARKIRASARIRVN